MLQDVKVVDSFVKFVHSKKQFKDAKILQISAMQHKGLEELIKTIFDTLQTLPPIMPIESEITNFDERDTSSVQCTKLSDGVFEVTGGLIKELSRRLVITEEESLLFVQKKLQEAGVIKTLKQLGLKNGDTLVLGDIELDYTE